MSEGLSPTEVAKELRHRHHHHEEEAREAIGRTIPIMEAVLLSVVTIVTAWAGYSAAKWSTDSRLDLAQASSLRIQANRALDTAAELRNFDSSTFNAWFIAYTLGNEQKMAIAERRFRPQFKVAFDAWLATSPGHQPIGATRPDVHEGIRTARGSAGRGSRSVTPRKPARTATTPGGSATTTSGSHCYWPRCSSWSASAPRSSRSVCATCSPPSAASCCSSRSCCSPNSPVPR